MIGYVAYQSYPIFPGTFITCTTNCSSCIDLLYLHTCTGLSQVVPVSTGWYQSILNIDCILVELNFCSVRQFSVFSLLLVFKYSCGEMQSFLQCCHVWLFLPPCSSISDALLGHCLPCNLVYF